MGILSFFHGIESLGSSLDFIPLFVIGNHDTFLVLEFAGKPCLTTYRAKSQGFYENGKFRCYVRTFILFPSFVVYDLSM